MARPAHAGATLASGRSAIREIAEQIVAIEAMSEPERNLTLSAGIVSGGTFVNVVPTICEAHVLVVTEDPDDFDRVRSRMTGLEARNEGIDPRGRDRPRPSPVHPHAPGPSSCTSTLVSLAREIGFDPEPGIVGGGQRRQLHRRARGSRPWTGSGPAGAGFHTPDEHVLVDSLIPRARLLSGLLLTLS